MLVNISGPRPVRTAQSVPARPTIPSPGVRTAGVDSVHFSGNGEVSLQQQAKTALCNGDIKAFNQIKKTLDERQERLVLAGCYLVRADLQGANLQGANLQGANLQLANLQGADLREANLQGANLQGANLQGANLQGAKLEGVIGYRSV